MRVLDLFSGIGGFSLGLEAAGMETVAFCEYEKWPQRVLAHHWPHVPIYPDVRELTYEQLKRDGINNIDVVAGGYPCQPFSLAGERKGVDDERHLWPQMFRLIREIKPSWVIGENVAGHIGMGLEQVCIDLESEGFRTQPFVIPACAVNAIHRRDRVWILAYANRKRKQRLRDKLAEPGECGQGRANHAPYSLDNAANTGCERQSRQGRSEQRINSTQKRNRKIHRTLDALRWPTKPPVRRANDGVSRGLDKNRLKALGNAVVPQVVQVIGEAIMREHYGD